MEKQAIHIFWFRRDLRTADNAGLFHALNAGLPVLPVFIFDINILKQLPKDDARVSFIHAEIEKIKNTFEQHGSSLKTFYTTPVEAMEQLTSEYNIHTVFTNRDYEPYARERDQEVAQFLQNKGIQFRDFKDQLIFDHHDVVKEDGSPYTVFTPYYRKWLAKFDVAKAKEFPSQNMLHSLLKTTPFRLQTLEQIGFHQSKINVCDFKLSEEILRNYATLRDFPSESATTRLSVHLRFGTVSIRQATQQAFLYSEKLLNELAWRNFYMDILWHFPHTEKNSFKPAYDAIRWQNNETEFERWCIGQTGYPLVDAGMRELNSTGYMHNRVRMITASFLCKHLLIDWRWGEAYFAEKLLDFDLAANNGGWQWAAGSGCDAAPYFRVFNPALQSQKFDPQANYLKQWLPELGTNHYPGPIVEHSFARKRAIETYRHFLKT